MHLVNHVCRDIHGALEAESDISAPYVVVNCFGKTDHIKPVLLEYPRRRVRAVSAERHKTVKTHLLIVFGHRFESVEIFARVLAHRLIPMTRGAKDGTAERQNTRKLFFVHRAVCRVDQAAKAVRDADNLGVVKNLI